MELNLSKEARTAIYQMVHHTSGIDPKDIANAIGDSHKTLLNFANPNMDTHVPSLKKIEAMITYTQNPALVKAWAHKLGFVLVPVVTTEINHQVSVIESLLTINAVNGQVNQQVMDILKDGVVTPSEMDDADQVLEEIENQIRLLRNALRSESSKYLSKLQNEKA